MITQIGGASAITSGTAAANTCTGKQKIAKMSDIATVVLASAVAAKYHIAKPNKEQVKAANELLQNQLPESQGDLQNAQSDMLEASEEVTALTEEANEANEFSFSALLFGECVVE